MKPLDFFENLQINESTNYLIYSGIVFLLGFCTGIILQYNWFLSNCILSQGKIKTTGSCYLYGLRIFLGGLILGVLLFALWKILSHFIVKLKKDSNYEKIYKKTFLPFLYFSLYFLTPFVNKNFHVYIFISIILLTSISFSFFFYKDLKGFLKTIFNQKRWGFLIFTILSATLFFDALGSFFSSGKFLDPNYFLRGFFIYNFVIVFSIASLLMIFTNRFLISLLFTLMIIALLTFINILKIHFLQYPIYLWDYQLITEAIATIPMMFNLYIVNLFFIILFLIISFLSYYFYRNDKQRALLKTRIIVFGALIFALTIWFFVTPDVSNPKHDMFPDLTKRKRLVSTKGLFYYLFLNGKFLNFAYVPKNYDKNLISNIKLKYFKNNNKINYAPPKINVIFYMMESFFDPTRLGVKYKNNPIPNFHLLSKKYPSGSLLTSIYGGMTANTEYEIMTGFSAAENLTIFFPGSTVYNQGFTNNINALPRIFKKWNYHTLAIDGLKRSFMNRDRVYPLMAFDNFLAFEEDFPQMKLDYGYCSDQNIVDLIIENSQKHFPLFAFTVTMSTHGRYNSRIPLNPKFEVLNTNLALETKRTLQRYAEVINLADLAIKNLIDHFKQTQNKTIILFFGDHLPAITSVYDDLNSFKKTWPQNEINMYSVPLLIWANFELPKESIFTSTIFLSNYLFKYMGINPPPFQFEFIRELQKKFPILSNIVMDSKSNFLKNNSLPEEYEDLLNSYKTLQYDVIKGKGYSVGQ